jgi:hypothetical protein
MVAWSLEFTVAREVQNIKVNQSNTYSTTINGDFQVSVAQKGASFSSMEIASDSNIDER